MDDEVGSQTGLFIQKHHDFKLNLIANADLLSVLVFKAEKSRALMIGGGIQNTTLYGGINTERIRLYILHHGRSGI
jgi:deoxyhypusine synthase